MQSTQSATTTSAPSATPSATPAGTLIGVLFFGSGIPALLYQLVWQRALFEIFGVQIEAVTVIVTAFMIGLGLGSLAGGWLSTRAGLSMLRIFALIEVSIAVFGVASLTVFGWISEHIAGVSLLTTSALTLALVIAPTMLMGATLPLLVNHWVSSTGCTGEAVGRLYCVNTLGAAFACVLAAFVIFPLSGMRTTTYIAAGINVVVALSALWLHFRRSPSAAATRVGKPALGDQSVTLRAIVSAPMRFRLSLALAALGGGVSMAFEVFFFRVISFATGGSANAFAITLAIFLAGLAAGAQCAGVWCTEDPKRIARRLLNTLFVATLVSAAFLPLVTLLATLGKVALFPFAYTVVFIIASAWGTLLPLLSQLSIAPDRRAGLHTSQLYLANIAGSASGSLLTGFVAMHYLGLTQVALVLTLASALVVLTMARALSGGRRLMRRITLGVLGVVLMTGVTSALPTRGLYDALLYKGTEGVSPIADVFENRHGILAVADDTTVYGGGVYDGKFNVDPVVDTNMVFRPYGLAAVHANPRRVLMVGLSSGSWAQIVVNMPGVESLTVVELNDGYASLIARHPNVASLLQNSKVTLITDDGRRWLRHHDERQFDMIVMNTTFFTRGHASLLLSSEMLGLVRTRLAPGGILMYNTTGSQRAQRTGCEAFAHGFMLGNNLVVSPSALEWDLTRWRDAMLAWRIDGKPVIDAGNPAHLAFLSDFKQRFPGPDVENTAATPGQAIAMPSCTTILSRTQGYDIVTDDNMGSEWRFLYGTE